MTRVDFYILAEHAQGNRHLLACRLADKAWKQGHRIYIHTSSEAESKQMDRLLWTFQESSFLPHGLIRQAEPDLNHILIGHSTDTAEEHDVLINLATGIPEFFSRFERVAEPIGHNDAIRKAGRVKFRFYRDRGYPLQSHEIK